MGDSMRYISLLLSILLLSVVGCTSSGSLDLSVVPPFYSLTSPDWTQTFTGTTLPSAWTPELTASGEGNSEFELYTPQNVTIKNNTLYIYPGLTKNLAIGPGQGVWNPNATGASPPAAPAVGTVSSMSVTAPAVLTLAPNLLGDSVVWGCGNSVTSPTMCASWGQQPFYYLDLGTSCTDDGTAFGETNGCVQGSGFYVLSNFQTSSCSQNNSCYYSIINPVTSARVSLKNNPPTMPDGTKGFQYGRLEILAKIPSGDWLWPAMWMLPVGTGISPQNPAGTGVYGTWPRSGEIDILESRGNSRACSEAYMAANPRSASGAVQSFASTLHWGPYYTENAFERTHTEYSVLDSNPTLDTQYHIYGLRWNSTGLYTYIDNDTNHVLEVNFQDQSFTERATGGAYQHCLKNSESATYNCTHTESVPAILPSTWTGTTAGAVNWPTNAGPFDQPFYLILNVAIGGAAGEGTSAYFPDGWCNKPWVTPAADKPYPVVDFYAAQSSWLSTWSNDGGQTINDTAALKVKGIQYWTEANAGTMSRLSPSAGQ